MDHPFLPALISFGPFFLMLFLFALMRRGQEPKKVPPYQIATAFVVALMIGVAGATASYLLI